MSFKVIVEDEQGRSHVVVEGIPHTYEVPDNIRMQIQIAIANAAYWTPPIERES